LFGVFKGVTGIVYEPIKGGKREGAKGVAKGLGRGFIGIIAQPIAGTVGFF
jgi:sterol 3beta-glucosyltransferase